MARFIIIRFRKKKTDIANQFRHQKPVSKFGFHLGSTTELKLGLNKTYLKETTGFAMPCHFNIR